MQRLCYVTYVVLAFNHVFEIDGQCSAVELKYRKHKQQYGGQELRHFTYFTPLSVTRKVSPLIAFDERFYHNFKRFFKKFPRFNVFDIF